MPFVATLDAARAADILWTPSNRMERRWS